MSTQAGPMSARHRLGRAAPLTHWVQALAVRELAERVAGCTLWWRLTEGGSGDSMDIVRGLPDYLDWVAEGTAIQID